MPVKLLSERGNLDIVLFEKAAPLSSRCLQQQIISGAWNNAVFEVVSDEYVSLSPAQGTIPQIRKENPRGLFNRRGLVAYAINSTSELLFCRSNHASIKAGTVVGKLSNDSIRTLDSIASGLQSSTKSTSHNEGISEQLKKVIEFEKRLTEWRT